MMMGAHVNRHAVARTGRDKSSVWCSVEFGYITFPLSWWTWVGGWGEWGGTLHNFHTPASAGWYRLQSTGNHG